MPSLLNILGLGNGKAGTNTPMGPNPAPKKGEGLAPDPPSVFYGSKSPKKGKRLAPDPPSVFYGSKSPKIGKGLAPDPPASLDVKLPVKVETPEPPQPKQGPGEIFTLGKGSIEPSTPISAAPKNPAAGPGHIGFFHNILTTTAASIPKGAQWLVYFTDLQKNILPGIKSALTMESKTWQIEKASQAITGNLFQKTQGCVFCQAIGLPGEDLTVNPAGNITTNSLMRSYVGEGRTQWPVMRMSFMDTNVSFVDSFLRAWVISTGQHGLIARDRGTAESYRTDMICYKIGTFTVANKPTIIAQYNFYDICCVSVNEEEYTYEAATSYSKREAKFLYNHYSVDTVTNNVDFLGAPTKIKVAPKFPF